MISNRKVLLKNSRQNKILTKTSSDIVTCIRMKKYLLRTIPTRKKCKISHKQREVIIPYSVLYDYHQFSDHYSTYESINMTSQGDRHEQLYGLHTFLMSCQSSLFQDWSLNTKMFFVCNFYRWIILYSNVSV